MSPAHSCPGNCPSMYRLHLKVWEERRAEGPILGGVFPPWGGGCIQEPAPISYLASLENRDLNFAHTLGPWRLAACTKQVKRLTANGVRWRSDKRLRASEYPPLIVSQRVGFQYPGRDSRYADTKKRLHRRSAWL